MNIECPKCGTIFLGALYESPIAVQDGDFGVCTGCFEILRVVKFPEFRIATEEDLKEIPPETVARAKAQTKAMRDDLDRIVESVTIARRTYLN